MIDFTVASNLDDIIGALREAEAKHVPFAWTLALNRTAGQAQAELRTNLPADFTIRRNWTERGIRVKGATKAAPVAYVFTKDWYMQDQETGAERRPAKAPTLFIPSLNVRESGSFSGEVVKDMRPKALLRAGAKADLRAVARQGKGKARAYGGPRMGKDYAKPLAFVAALKTGKTGLFIRRDHHRVPLTLLYTLQDSVKIAPRWGFAAKTTRVADKILRRRFIEALHHALATAKDGPKRSDFIDYLKEHT